MNSNRKPWIVLAGIGVILTALLSCHNGPSALQGGAADTKVPAKSDTVKMDLKSLHLNFASPKDASCGMPLTAGLEDTARYKGKLYGFCSKECKDAFLKDPEAGLATLK